MTDLWEQIKHDEGYRCYPYRCSAGVLTIGYGRNIDEVGGGPGIAEDEAAHMLRNDLHSAEIDMKGIFPNWADIGQARRNAFINMRFNLGPTRFRGFVNMIEAARRGVWGIAGMEARDSRWYFQVGGRAERIARTIETGVSL